MKLQPKRCEVCGKPCAFVECKTNPPASEWYCEKCHKSYDVPELVDA